MKYIIKNCPATFQNFEDKFVCTSRIKQKGFPFYCQDCADCLIKRIVELCKEKIKVCEGCSKTADINIDCVECDEKGEANISRAIVNLLEIEEANEE